MQRVFDSIVALTDEFSHQHLNEEYAQLARYAAAALCRKRPSPLVNGYTDSWACGIIYALGFVNFLFDKSQKPYINATDLCKSFNISKSTGVCQIKGCKRCLKMAMCKVKALTPRGTHNTLESTMDKINQWYVGWSNYYSLTNYPSQLRKIEAHIRRRLRSRLVSQQKRRQFLYQNLVKRGGRPNKRQKTSFQITNDGRSLIPER